MTTIQKVERVLNLLPEVTWDRWAGELEEHLVSVGVFGWVPRADGRSDFVFCVLTIRVRG